MRRYQLVPAGSVDEAISILEVDRYFDLILCDVMMPRRLGVELYTWVEEQHPSLLHRVVLMTGGIRDSRVRDAIMQGSYLVLLKPFDSVVLRLLVADRGMARPERSRSPATEPARGARLTKRLRTIGNSTFIR
jgi:DNA-binding NtrC family response regulator